MSRSVPAPLVLLLAAALAACQSVPPAGGPSVSGSPAPSASSEPELRPVVLRGVATFRGEPVAGAAIRLVDARSGEAGRVIAVGAGHVVAIGAGHAQAPTATAGVIAIGAGHFTTDAKGAFEVPVAGLASGEAARLVVQTGTNALSSTVAGTPNGVIAVGAGHVIAVGAGHYRLQQAETSIALNETTTALSHLAAGALRASSIVKPAAAAPAVAALFERLSALGPKFEAYFASAPTAANALVEATAPEDGAPRSASAIEALVSGAGAIAELREANRAALATLETAAKDPANAAPGAPALAEVVTLFGTGLEVKSGGGSSSGIQVGLPGGGGVSVGSGDSDLGDGSETGSTDPGTGSSGGGNNSPPAPTLASVAGAVLDEAGAASAALGGLVEICDAQTQAVLASAPVLAGAYTVATGLTAGHSVTLALKQNGLLLHRSAPFTLVAGENARPLGDPANNPADAVAFLSARPVLQGDLAFGAQSLTIKSTQAFDATNQARLTAAWRLYTGGQTPAEDGGTEGLSAISAFPTFVQQGTQIFTDPSRVFTTTWNQAGDTTQLQFPLPLAGSNTGPRTYDLALVAADTQGIVSGGLPLGGRLGANGFAWGAATGEVLAKAFLRPAPDALVAMDSAGARWRKTRSNVLRVSVPTDTTPPTLVSVTATGRNVLRLTFSEPMIGLGRDNLADPNTPLFDANLTLKLFNSDPGAGVTWSDTLDGSGGLLGTPLSLLSALLGVVYRLSPAEWNVNSDASDPRVFTYTCTGGTLPQLSSHVAVKVLGNVRDNAGNAIAPTGRYGRAAL